MSMMSIDKWTPISVSRLRGNLSESELQSWIGALEAASSSRGKDPSVYLPELITIDVFAQLRARGLTPFLKSNWDAIKGFLLSSVAKKHPSVDDLTKEWDLGDAMAAFSTLVGQTGLSDFTPNIGVCCA